MRATLAPQVFELDDVPRVIGAGPGGLLLNVAEACPSAAIRLIDAESREQLYP